LQFEPGVLSFRAMEPILTERDIEMLLLNEDALVNLGAMLGLRAKLSEVAALGEGSRSLESS
jgi:hypothetical protein